MKNIFTLTEQIKDNIQAFGHFEAAQVAKKRIPFTLFYFFAFGRLPSTVLKVRPIFNSSNESHATYKTVEVR